MFIILSLSIMHTQIRWTIESHMCHIFAKDRLYFFNIKFFLKVFKFHAHLIHRIHRVHVWVRIVKQFITVGRNFWVYISDAIMLR